MNEDKTAEQLRACPFCGLPADIVDNPNFSEPYRYAVECIGCGARSKDAGSHEQVIGSWNNRADSGEAVAWLVESEKAGRVSAELHELSADKVIADVVREYGAAYGATTKRPLFTQTIATAVDVLNLQRFVGKMFEATEWPDGGDVDGFEFQRIATECGLLAEVEMEEPCGEVCQCRDMGEDFPATCYRTTQLYRYCKDAIANREGK